MIYVWECIVSKFSIYSHYSIGTYILDLTLEGLQCLKWGFSIFGRLPKLQKSVDAFEILHNHVLSCHLLNKIMFIQDKFTIIDL